MKKNADIQVQRGRASDPALRIWILRLIYSHRNLAICNFCSGISMAAFICWLNHIMVLFKSSTLISNIIYFLLTYTPLPTFVIQAASQAYPALIIAMFMLATLVFSMTLTAWCMTDGSESRKTPNKLLSFTIVVTGLGLQAWAGATVEEFFLVALPATAGIALLLGSVMEG